MGAMEIVVILLIYLLLFGAKGVPTLARSLGTALRQVRAATDEIQREILSSANEVQSEVRTVRRTTEAAVQGTVTQDPVAVAATAPKPEAGKPEPGAEANEGAATAVAATATQPEAGKPEPGAEAGKAGADAGGTAEG
jgi:sec-independent protein translocase protein TatA